MTQILPKTLAKMLSYIGYHAPGEYGLFWDEDGTMPWKEFYWALQEDPKLRYVREATIRELQYLGCELPFQLDGNRLRVASHCPLVPYQRVVPPERLYYGCSLRAFAHLQAHGLDSHHRTFAPLAATRLLSETIAKRRDPSPVVIQVLAAKANKEGFVFRSGGGDLYLVQALPAEYLMFPPVSEEKLAAFVKEKSTVNRKFEHGAYAPAGSFLVEPGHLEHTTAEEKAPRNAGKKSAARSDWKREGRKLRRKRTI